MINKNQYKVRNVKKILHKVGKNWLVVSTALLGMVAGGAAAGTATHADPTPANANHSDGYVNHQVTQSAGSASPQLVHSDGTSLASTSAGSSVASGSVSPSASKSTMLSLAPSASSAVQFTRPQQRMLGRTPSSSTSITLTSQQENSKATYELDNVIDDMMSLNAQSSFGSNVTSSAFNDFNASPNASNFVKSFNSNCLTVSDGVGVVRDHFSILFNNPVISSAYQDLHTSEESANGRSILLQLLQTNPSNESSELTSTSSFISGNLSGFARNGDLPLWKSIATNVNDDKNNVSNFDSIIDSLVSNGNVSNAVSELANETSAERSDFKTFITHTDNDFNVVRYMKSSGDAFKKFANMLLSDSYVPSSVKSLLTKLTSDNLEPVASRYFHNFAQYDHRLVHTLLNDLINATGDSYKNYLNALNTTIGAQIYSSLYEYGMPTLGSNLQTIANDDFIKANTSKNSANSNNGNTPSDNKSRSAKNVTPKPQNTNKQAPINDKGKQLTPNNHLSGHKNNSNSNSSKDSSNNIKSSATSTSTNNQSSANSIQPSVKSSNASTAHSSNTNSGDKTNSTSPTSTTSSSSGKSEPISPSDNNSSKNSAISDSSRNISSGASSRDNGSQTANNSRPTSVASNPSNKHSDKSTISGTPSTVNSLSNASKSNYSNNTKLTSNSITNQISSDSNNATSLNPSNNTLSSSSRSNYNHQQSNGIFPWVASLVGSLEAAPSVYGPQPTSVAQRSAASVTQRSVSDLKQMKVGQQVAYHNMIITRLRPTYRWFKVRKACFAHNTLDSVGKAKDYRAVLRPGMKFRLGKIFKAHVGSKVWYCYEINVNGHNYFVTANHRYTSNAYYRIHEHHYIKGLKGHRIYGRYGHRYFKAIVKKPFWFYDSAHFNKANQLWMSHRGQLIDIKGVYKIGNVTRLALTDGTYITANREFLKLI